MNYTTSIGLDVHKETISVAKFGGLKDAVDLGTIANKPDAIARLVRKLGPIENLQFCYEAGPCGYSVYRQLTGMGANCIVVAPSLIPVRPGERVKTDRRDAMKLAKLLHSGELTPVWVPDEEHEAFRQLERAREDAKQDVTRARHRISKFLLVNGVSSPAGTKAWSKAYKRWLDTIQLQYRAQNVALREDLKALRDAEERVERLEQEIAEIYPTSKLAPMIDALQALRGVSLITAAGIVGEAGDLTRFQSASQAMAYSGLVPSEHSSGKSIRRGPITKAGNSHLRHILVEAAWHYRHRPAVGDRLKKRQLGLPEHIKEMAWKAQYRLNRKYLRGIGRGKSTQVAVVAVARELVGFMWAIAKEMERIAQNQSK